MALCVSEILLGSDCHCKEFYGSSKWINKIRQSSIIYYIFHNSQSFFAEHYRHKYFSQPIHEINYPNFFTAVTKKTVIELSFNHTRMYCTRFGMSCIATVVVRVSFIPGINCIFGLFSEASLIKAPKSQFLFHRDAHSLDHWDSYQTEKLSQ